MTDTILGEDAYVLASAFLEHRPPLTIPAFLPEGSSARNTADQQHDSYAIFGQADYHFTEQFVVTGGLRWTDENKEMTNIFTENPTPAPPGFHWLDRTGPQAKCR